MKASYSQIKSKAKRRLSQRFGDAALIVIIPGLIVWIANMILGQIFAFLPDIAGIVVSNIFSFVLSGYSGYITLKLMLQYARGKDGIDFDEFFKFDDKFVPYVVYTLIISFVNLLAFIPVIPFYFQLFREIGTTQDPEAIAAYLESTDVINGFMGAFGLTAILAIIIAVILVRLSFTQHLILHQRLNITDAMKKSLAITKGNWWRIFFFPLSFILWFILGFITCGLGFIYVIPFLTLATTYLYFALLKEYGDETDEYNPGETVLEEDFLAEDFKEEKKEEDPFDYYE